MPLLRNRALMMRVTLLSEDQIRPNIMPKKLKDDENNALSTPLMINGSAEELDENLGSTLVSYSGSHIRLRNSLDQAKADMEAAEQEAKAGAKAKQHKNRNTTAVTPAVNKPSAASKAVAEQAPARPEPAKVGSRFDLQPVTEAAHVRDEDEVREEEILSNLEQDGEHESDLDAAA